VWPGEREVVAVWADELQARGDPLGDVIALHLRAEQIAGDPRQAAERREIVRAAEARRLDAIEHLLGGAIGELPRLRLRWQLGLVRGLYLDATLGAHPPAQLVLEVVAKLLRRPVLRFLDDIQIEAVVPDTGIERALLDELAASDVVARPRRIVLGSMPRSFRQQLPMPRLTRLSRRSVTPEHLEAAPHRGLIWYGVWGRVQPLGWTRGNRGTRIRNLESLLERPWTDGLAHLIAASVWDTSLVVRRRALAALPSLPDSLAPAVPSVLALDLHGARVFGDIAARCLDRIVDERPHWIASVADNFTAREPWIALWLAELAHRHPAARRAAPRLRSMIRRLTSGAEVRSVGVGRLRHALGRFDAPLSDEGDEPDEEPGDDETIAELLAKLGRHREL
jgi:hypothetical protein